MFASYLNRMLAVLLLSLNLAVLRADESIEAASVTEAAAVAETVVEGEAYTVTGQREASQLQLAKPSAVGSNLAIPLLDMPVSVDLISAEAMRQRGYNSAHDAAASGVGMITYMEKNANPLFSSRGFFRDNVVVLRDGLRLDSQVESSRPLDTFNLERVEVIKGPSSLMTGLGAIGASINYVSKKPVRTGSLTELLAGYDSFGRTRAGASHSLGGQWASYRLGVAHTGGTGYQDRTGQNNVDLSLGLDGRPLDKLRLEVQLDHQTTDIKGHNGIPTIDNGLAGQPFNGTGAVLAPVSLTNNYDVVDGFSRSQGLRGRIDLQWDLDEALALRNTSYAFDSVQEERFTDRYHVQAGNTTVQVRLNDYRRWDGHQGNLTQLSLDLGTDDVRLRSAIGIDFRHERAHRMDPNGTNTLINGVDLLKPGQIQGPAANYAVVPATANKRVFSHKNTLYVEEHLDLLDRVQFLGGLSMDQFAISYQPNANLPHNRTTYPGVLNGRGGVVLKVLEGANLYGSYTTAAAPNYAPINITTTDAGFQLEKGRQWEGGIKALRWGGRLQGTFSYYLIEKTDLVSWAETFQGSGVYTRQNVGKQSAHGSELALSIRPWGGLLLEGNYAHTTSRFDSFRNSATNDRSGNSPSYVPTVQTSLNLRYEFEMGLGLGLLHRHVGDRFSDHDNRSIMPGYQMLDADISYRYQGHSLTLRGKNLSDEKAVISARTPSAVTTEFKVAEPRAVEAVYSAKF